MNTVLEKISAGIAKGAVVTRRGVALARRADWVPAAMVLSVMLLAGSRLITLSMQHHAAQARETAQVIVDRYGRAIEAGLQDLARQARSAAAASSPVPQANRKIFRLAVDGTVVDSAESDAAVARAIKSEWAAADSRLSAAHAGASAPGFLGPVRYGSQWLVAVRVPIPAPQSGWSIAYQTLDVLLTHAGITNLAKTGDDFELSQDELASPRSRVLWTTAARRLSEPIARAIQLPGNLTQSLRGAELTLAARPRTGWYPAGELTTDIGLLVVVTWILTIGTYDLSRNSRRLHAAVLAEKRRARGLQQRLINEIEQRQSLQESLDHAGYHDAFTGLPNRRYFVAQLERALRELRIQHRHLIAVVLVDIERFKLINDTLGHTAGDELMIQTARRFERVSAAFEGLLARWGGDQFALLLFDLHSKDSALALARLLSESLRSPFKLRKHRVSVAARVGVTCVDGGARRAEDVLREADIALSRTKSRTDTPIVAYVPAMGGEILGLVSLEADLHVAVDRDELLLLFQPVVDLRAGRIVGAEALLRWRHPVEGVLMPDRFLPIAEEVGLTAQITRWTIWRACQVISEWRRLLPSQTEFWISVNLPGAALRDPNLADYVESTLEETGASAQALKLELTESELIRDVGAAKEILERLHEMGIQLMLDDFGTGYSALSHLQFFPFDYVKIDRPLSGGNDSAQALILSAMVRMVASLGLKTVAEAVETEASALMFQRAGCELAQGYFFSEPVETLEALRRLRMQEFRAPRARSPALEPVEPLVRTQQLQAPELLRSNDPSDSSIAGPQEATGLPLEDTTPRRPPPDETLILANVEFPNLEDSRTLAPPDETMALAIDDFEAQRPRDPTMVLALEDTVSPSRSDETLILTDVEPSDIKDSCTPAPADETMALAIDDFEAQQPRDPTMVLPLEDAASPSRSDETLILTDVEPSDIKDSCTPAPPDETMALATDDFEAQQPQDPTMVLPLEDFASQSQSDKTLVLTDVELSDVKDFRTPALPDEMLISATDASAARWESGPQPVPSVDHSSTQQLEVNELGLPFEESPTLAERFRVLGGDSPDPSESDEAQPLAEDVQRDGQRGDMHRAPTGSTHDESEDDPDEASHKECSRLGHFGRKRRVR